jgi:hypothetical protein
MAVDTAVLLQQIVMGPRSVELALGLTIEVNVVRSKRAKCPNCHLRRVLYHLSLWVKDHPSGSGSAMCARCAGFRG